MLARFRTSIEIFREANVPLFSELEELGARYQRITGAMTVEWDGEESPLPAAPAVPQEPRSRGAGARLPRGHAAVHRGARRAGRPVRPDVRRCGSRRRATPGSPTSATTSSPPSSASTTPRPIASGFTTRSSRPSRRRSRGCSSSGGSGWRSTRCARGISPSIPTAPRRSARSRPWTSSSAPAARGLRPRRSRRSAASSRP